MAYSLSKEDSDWSSKNLGHPFRIGVKNLKGKIALKEKKE